jgi:group II intron reverse transcriptase/maturase
LESLWQGLKGIGGGWVLEVDIQKFFDTLDHARLREFLHRRIRDGVLLRLIGKWLNAGVLEGGVLTNSDQGTPQGGVISPLLANVYLHYVLDEWFEKEVKPRLGGHAFLIRYADDFVIGFSREADARRVREVLPKRFEKYGLKLHPQKTRLVPFERPRNGPVPVESGPPADTFDLLGFTHYWGRSRKGFWVVKRQTAANRFSRVVKKIAQWCRCNRHLPIAEQQTVLSQKLSGHYAYFGITGNYRRLKELRVVVTEVWRKWLSRRGARPPTWEWVNGLLERLPLPAARVVHSVYT